MNAITFRKSVNHYSLKNQITKPMKKLGLLILTLLAFVSINAQTPGQLDESFAETGVLQFPIGDSFDEAHSVLVQPDGKILTVGRARFNGN